MIRRAPGRDEQQRWAQGFFEWGSPGDVQMAKAIARAIGNKNAGSGGIKKNRGGDGGFAARARGRGDNVLGEGGRGNDTAHNKTNYSQGIENFFV